jgi:hypothetical protein
VSCCVPSMVTRNLFSSYGREEIGNVPNRNNAYSPTPSTTDLIICHVTHASWAPLPKYNKDRSNQSHGNRPQIQNGIQRPTTIERANHDAQVIHTFKIPPNRHKKQKNTGKFKQCHLSTKTYSICLKVQKAETYWPTFVAASKKVSNRN